MIGLARWIEGLTRRERVLLALLVLAVLPAALGLGVALPLLERREAARAELARAEAGRVWLAARLAEAAALPAPGPRPAPEGLAALEARLAAAALTAASGGETRLSDAGEGIVLLALDGADFAALMAWLEQIEAEAGYALAGLTLTPGAAAGLVDAEVRLSPHPGR